MRPSRGDNRRAVTDFYDPDLYTLAIGPSPRVAELYLGFSDALSPPILELGCGTGDVLLSLARRGFSVSGLDRSARMLECARERLRAEPEHVGRRVTLHQGNMESFAIGQRFGTILIPNEGVLHLLDRAALAGCFRCAADHLVPNGGFIFDVPPFDVADLGRWAGPEREAIRYRGTYALPDGAAMRVLEQTEYDQGAGILTARFTYERLDPSGVTREVRHRELRLHPRRVDELLAHLELAGFAVVDVAHHRVSGQHLVTVITARRA
jgi:SAM-dependent methyltransferase